MNSFRLLLVIVVAAIFAGCIPESDNPISSPDSSMQDARLTGVWYAENGGDRIYLHFGPGEGRRMDVTEVDHEKNGKMHANSYTVFSSRIKGVRYMNIQAAGDKSAPYYFARYGVDSADVLRIWLMSPDFVKKAIRGGRIRGTIKEDSNGVDSIRIQSSSAIITKFINNCDRKVLFDQFFGEFRRVNPKKK
jgi:hypothetical protein